MATQCQNDGLHEMCIPQEWARNALLPSGNRRLARRSFRSRYLHHAEPTFFTEHARGDDQNLRQRTKQRKPFHHKSAMRNPLLLLVLLLCLPVSLSFLLSRECKSTVTSSLWGKRIPVEKKKYVTASEKFNARWNMMFERLKKYKEKNGDCLVPQRYEDDPELGRWVETQRRISTLDDRAKQERRDKLNSIGFVWRVRESYRTPKLDKQWNDKFERLKQYKREHGDCLAPKRYEDDPQLARWVDQQRALFAN